MSDNLKKNIDSEKKLNYEIKKSIRKSDKDFLDKCYDKFDTGDIIFFYGGGWISNIIAWITGSSYSHMAMILKDPVNINIKLEGLYIIESNYPTSSKYKHEHPLLLPEITSKYITNGVQITPFEDIFKRGQNLYYRKLNCLRNNDFRKKVKKIHDKVHHKPYDLDFKDWLSAEINIIINNIKNKTYNPIIKRDRTDKFWCSALIGYFYVKL